MAPQKALCVTGMPGSGKEGLLEAARGRGIPVVRMGDAVREEARRRGLDGTDAAIGGMAAALRKKEGADVWARRTLDRVEADAVVIDGVRSPAELETFREAIPDVRVAAVHASPGTRYERLRGRGRSDDRLDEAGYRARDRRELRWGLGQAIAMADYMIVNEGDPDELRAQCERVLKHALG